MDTASTESSAQHDVVLNDAISNVEAETRVIGDYVGSGSVPSAPDSTLVSNSILIMV